MADPVRRGFIAGVAALPFGATGMAAAAAQPRCEPDPAIQRRLSDWPNLARYAADNQAVRGSGTRVDIVFMGDSITEGWMGQRPGFFTPGRVGRGISGQTTAQMVLRMMPDVVGLRPRAVHIMAGTNDVAGNTGPMTPDMTLNNIRAMAALARQHGIAVLLASIPPAAAFPWRPEVQPVERIRDLNRRIAAFAREEGHAFVDYDPVLATPQGAMRQGLADDGVHPTGAGYDAMARVAEPALARILGRGRRR